LFLAIISHADDEGRFRASSRGLASALFPYDDDAREEIGAWLEELEAEGKIRRWKVNGDTYGDIPSWPQHQKIDRPSKSKLPVFVEDSGSVANQGRPDSTRAREGSRGFVEDSSRARGRTKDQGPRIKDQNLLLPPPCEHQPEAPRKHAALEEEGAEVEIEPWAPARDANAHAPMAMMHPPPECAPRDQPGPSAEVEGSASHWLRQARELRAAKRPEVAIAELPPSGFERWFEDSLAAIGDNRIDAWSAMLSAYASWLDDDDFAASGWPIRVFMSARIWPQRVRTGPSRSRVASRGTGTSQENTPPAPCAVCGEPSTGEVWGARLCPRCNAKWLCEAGKSGAIAAHARPDNATNQQAGVDEQAYVAFTREWLAQRKAAWG
jgi:hypothetical protein